MQFLPGATSLSLQEDGEESALLGCMQQFYMFGDFYNVQRGVRRELKLFEYFLSIHVFRCSSDCPLGMSHEALPRIVSVV